MLKYTHEWGEIWLEAKREDDHVIIQVRDNGMGIAPEMLPRVFDRTSLAQTDL
jgi:signal transduction histidine kinase